MDKGLKVSFPAYDTMYVPPALINKFHELMRGCEFYRMEYVPGQPDGEYERLEVEGGIPSIEFDDEPELIMSLANFEEMRAIAKAKKEAEEADENPED